MLKSRWWLTVSKVERWPFSVIVYIIIRRVNASSATLLFASETDQQHATIKTRPPSSHNERQQNTTYKNGYESARTVGQDLARKPIGSTAAWLNICHYRSNKVRWHPRFSSRIIRATLSDLICIYTCISSGIGLEACKLLAMMNPTNRIVLVGRNQDKADIAKETVVESVWPACVEREKYSMNIIPLECDHCSLSSVRSFSEELRRKLDESYHPSKWVLNGIDVLCLNAAVLQPNDSKAIFTDDGFEVTFQTNHLAPFLIANLVTDMMNPGGRVVFSTSGLHCAQKLAFDGAIDLATGTLRKKRFEMMDGSEFHFKRSYSLAKLCNVAICVELNARLRRQHVIANCFSPGLMTSSGLFRNQPRCGDSIATVPHVKEVLMREKTVQWGAGSLVYMAVADATGEHGSQYWRDAESFAGSSAVYGKEFCPTFISDENVDENQRETLWTLSCQLTGITCDR